MTEHRSFFIFSDPSVGHSTRPTAKLVTGSLFRFTQSAITMPRRHLRFHSPCHPVISPSALRLSCCCGEAKKTSAVASPKVGFFFGFASSPSGRSKKAKNTAVAPVPHFVQWQSQSKKAKAERRSEGYLVSTASHIRFPFTGSHLHV